MSVLEIRPPAEAEWPQCAALADDLATAGDGDVLGVSAEDLRARTPGTGRHLAVAVEGERVLGCATMGPSRPGPGAHVGTLSVGVAVAARGRGIGRALGEYAVDWHRAQGRRAVALDGVVASDGAALGLCRALGFQTVGRLPQAHQLPSGGLVDLHVMHLHLADAAPQGEGRSPNGAGHLVDRERLLQVATEHFTERGWRGTHVADIAAAAGEPLDAVSRTFGSKADLLISAFRRAGFGEHADLKTSVAALGLHELDVDQRLDVVVRLAGDVLQAFGPFTVALNEAAVVDATARAIRRGEELRRVGVSRGLVDLLTREEPPPADAVAVVQMLTSAETYLSLTGLGWSHERYLEWLREALDQAVNGPVAAAPRPR